ncbi:MAG: hypothetical protein AAB733_01400 [Patescibacteria group bacterium]
MRFPDPQRRGRPWRRRVNPPRVRRSRGDELQISLDLSQAVAPPKRAIMVPVVVSPPIPRMIGATNCSCGGMIEDDETICSQCRFDHGTGVYMR